MKIRPSLLALTLILTLSACTQPTAAPTPTVATLAPTETNTPIPATWTPLPTFTPLPTETLVPSETPTGTPSPTITPILLPAPILDSQGILMAYIPAGTYKIGGSSEVLSLHSVILTQAFYMDVYEVTNASYADCVAAGQCTPPFKFGGMESFTRESYYSNPEYADYPVVLVNWEQANTYCTWRGGRLPTEAEWEYAARGGLEGKTYPWGDEKPVCTVGAVNGANYDACSEEDTVSVGLFAPNGYGLYDMAGNVWEWVNDWYGDYPSGTVTDPTGPITGEYRVLRGGSWYNEMFPLSVAIRSNNDPLHFSGINGFRCMAPIEGATPQP